MIQQSVSDGICVLRLNAPPVNSITYALLEALCAAVRQAASDPAVRGIVVAGDAKHFSAGADVNLFSETRTAEDAVRMSRRPRRSRSRSRSFASSGPSTTATASTCPASARATTTALARLARCLM